MRLLRFGSKYNYYYFYINIPTKVIIFNWICFVVKVFIKNNEVSFKLQYLNELAVNQLTLTRIRKKIIIIANCVFFSTKLYTS